MPSFELCCFHTQVPCVMWCNAGGRFPSLLISRCMFSETQVHSRVCCPVDTAVRLIGQAQRIFHVLSNDIFLSSPPISSTVHRWWISQRTMCSCCGCIHFALFIWLLFYFYSLLLCTFRHLAFHYNNGGIKRGKADSFVGITHFLIMKKKSSRKRQIQRKRKHRF